ncbi:MAG: dihydroorotate dehydrogenase electron transfer subunit [Firmicutes bacterium]|nr:dihydroorotate dehydrogenase electron transfer subunit [Bacillota bacterium]
MQPKHYIANVVALESLTFNVFKMTLQLKTFPKIKPGQFLNIKVPGFSLRRPFGISHYSEKDKTVSFCFMLKGDGTKELAKAKVGDTLDVLMPLGNGFLQIKNKTVAIVSGGIGLFPLLPTAKGLAEAGNKVHSFLGFTNKDAAILLDEFKAHSTSTTIATDDGSIGTKGYVTDLIVKEFDKIKPDYIFACGPEGMFKTLKQQFFTADNTLKPQFAGTEIYVSLEQRMACGFGVGKCCNQHVKLESGDDHMARVCCDGPVFNLKEVVFDV